MVMTQKDMSPSTFKTAQHSLKTAVPTSCNPNKTSRSSLFKWTINGPFHSQTHNAIMWYKVMHATSPIAHFRTSFSRSHPLQNIWVPLYDQTCLPTNRVKILPSRVVPVCSVLRCSAFKLNCRLGTTVPH